MKILDVFDAELAALVAQVRGLSESDLGAATRCGEWPVSTLLGHVLNGLERSLDMLESPADAAVDPNPLIYYQSPLRYAPGRGPIRDRTARAAAARCHDGGEFAETIERAAQATTVGLRRLGPDAAVTTHWGPIITAENFTRTRIVEAAVHGLDLADALGTQAWATPNALEVVAGLLGELLGAPVPSTLGWTDLDVVLIGTGRVPLSDDDAETLGSLAASFPLFS